MKCKSCKRVIEDNSIFCNWCGKRQIKEHKQETKVPEPKQLASGAWNIYLRKEGISVTESTYALCKTKAQAYREGYIQKQAKQGSDTLGAVVDEYIRSRDGVLSPSTIRGYNEIRRQRFQAYMDMDIASIPWQDAISKESQSTSAKTVGNAWGLIAASLKSKGLEVPYVALPRKVKADRPWLDYEQIGKFLEAVYGEPCELGALLALHSLRRSEIYALTKSQVQDDIIKVAGAVVMDAERKYVRKAENKTDGSRRDIPIMIPRLRELVARAPDGPLVLGNPNTLYKQINSVCSKAGLPLVGVHGLRHSFASLAYHLNWSPLEVCSVGGWSDLTTVQRIYTHLAQQDRTDAIAQMEQFYLPQATKNTDNRDLQTVLQTETNKLNNSCILEL